jgi:hypothetical protein
MGTPENVPDSLGGRGQQKPKKSAKDCLKAGNNELGLQKF